MSYPFPGMNPWLENPLVWKGVHQRAITALAIDYSKPPAPALSAEDAAWAAACLATAPSSQ